MHHQVCTVSPTLARAWASPGAVPFLPPPNPAAVTAPTVCACGEPLTMEMERDLGECVECQFRAALLAEGRRCGA